MIAIKKYFIFVVFIFAFYSTSSYSEEFIKKQPKVVKKHKNIIKKTQQQSNSQQSPSLITLTNNYNEEIRDNIIKKEGFKDKYNEYFVDKYRRIYENLDNMVYSVVLDKPKPQEKPKEPNAFMKFVKKYILPKENQIFKDSNNMVYSWGGYDMMPSISSSNLATKTYSGVAPLYATGGYDIDVKRQSYSVAFGWATPTRFWGINGRFSFGLFSMIMSQNILNIESFEHTEYREPRVIPVDKVRIEQNGTEEYEASCYTGVNFMNPQQYNYYLNTKEACEAQNHMNYNPWVVDHREYINNYINGRLDYYDENNYTWSDIRKDVYNELIRQFNTSTLYDIFVWDENYGRCYNKWIYLSSDDALHLHIQKRDCIKTRPHFDEIHYTEYIRESKEETAYQVKEIVEGTLSTKAIGFETAQEIIFGHQNLYLTIGMGVSYMFFVKNTLITNHEVMNAQFAEADPKILFNNSQFNWLAKASLGHRFDFGLVVEATWKHYSNFRLSQYNREFNYLGLTVGYVF